jgi:hypothetical protein
LYRNHSGNLPAIHEMEQFDVKGQPKSLKNVKNEPKISIVIPRHKVDEMKIEYNGNIDMVKQESQGPAAHQGNEYEHQEHH